jgi:polysaccharide biosynthesis protein PslG
MSTTLRTTRGRLLALATALCLSAPAAAAAAQPNPFVGTVSDETFESLGYLYQPGSIDSIAAAGVGTLRQTFDWQYLSKGDSLNWDMLDHYIGGAAQRGITILPVLFDPPSNITTMPVAGALRGFYPPANPSAIGAYGAQLAARYGNNGSFWSQHPDIERHPITAWQIWNEPNLPVYWRPRLSPKGYAKMLCGAYRQIKAVDPSAEIVTAGLPKSHIRSSIWPSRYVPRVMRAGGRGCFDTVALNAYAPTGKGVVKLVSSFRRLLNRMHARNVNLRVTEFGWADQGPERPRAAYTAGSSRQGRFISAALHGLWKARKKLRLRGAVYYAWRDQPVYAGGKNFWGLHTGLTRVDGSAKPAMSWFRRAAHSLR